MDGESRIGLGDDCYLDLDGAVLIKDGQTVYLTPMTFRLLRYMADHMGSVLTVEELIRRLWGKQVMVHRDELYVYIRKIRMALEDEPNKPRCLKTFRNRGYVLYPRQKHGCRGRLHITYPVRVVPEQERTTGAPDE